jgi:hypothetical protein
MDAKTEKDYRIENLENILHLKISPSLREILPLKVAVPFRSDCEIIQKYLIKCGCFWFGNEFKTTDTYGYLYIEKCGRMCTTNDFFGFIKNDKFKEITLSELYEATKY